MEEYIIRSSDPTSVDGFCAYHVCIVEEDTTSCFDKGISLYSIPHEREGICIASPKKGTFRSFGTHFRGFVIGRPLEKHSHEVQHVCIRMRKGHNFESPKDEHDIEGAFLQQG